MPLLLFTPVISIWKACRGASSFPVQNAEMHTSFIALSPVPTRVLPTAGSPQALGTGQACEQHAHSDYGIGGLKAHSPGAWPLLPQDSISVEKPVFNLRILGSCQPAGHGTFLCSPPRIRKASFCSTSRK